MFIITYGGIYIYVYTDQVPKLKAFQVVCLAQPAVDVPKWAYLGVRGRSKYTFDPYNLCSNPRYIDYQPTYKVPLTAHGSGVFFDQRVHLAIIYLVPGVGIGNPWALSI